MIKRKYVVLLLLTLVSIPLTVLLYSNLAQAQSTVTGYVSVPAAAFVPITDNQSYKIQRVVRNYESIRGLFVGSVQLPHGATVTNVTFKWYDIGASDISFTLQMLTPSTTIYLATAWSSGNAGWGYSYDDTIHQATIDNSQYPYQVEVNIPPSHANYSFLCAFIEYTLPSGAAVGGFWIPVDKFSLLAPYIISTMTIILVASITVAYIKYRKKQ